MNREEARRLKLEFEAIKATHFRRFHVAGAPVILHRRSILDRWGPFGELHDSVKLKLFLQDLVDAIARCDFTVIASIAAVSKYPGRNWRVRAKKDALEFILTRYCGILHHVGYKGDVILETTDREEDRRLRDKLDELLQTGAAGRRPNYFASALIRNPFYFRRGDTDVAGIQLADLLATPLARRVLVQYVTNLLGKRIPTNRLTEFGIVLEKTNGLDTAMNEIAHTRLNKSFCPLQEVYNYGMKFLS